MPAGRPKGALNKATKDIKALAQKHTPAALKTLVRIMKVSGSDPARVAAAKELLDRAHGKAAQAVIGGGADDPPIKHVTRIELVDLK